MTVANTKKVGVLVASLYGGGAERAAIRLAEQISERFQVSVLTLEAGKDYDLAAQLTYVPLTAVDGRSSPWLKLLAAPLQAWRLRTLLKSQNYEAVITFTERPSMIGTLSKLLGAPSRLIMSFRNYQSDHLDAEQMGRVAKAIRNGAFKWMIRRSSTLSDAVTVLSEGAKADLVDNFGLKPDRIHTIFNEYDVEAILTSSRAPIPSQFEPLFGGKTITTAGRLARQKGHTYLLRSFKSILATTPEVRLVILGVGPLEGTLKQQCVDLGLPMYTAADCALDRPAKPGVYFLGFQKNPFAMIGRSTIFAFPSLWEGFGNALLEAMACRVPVVSSDCRAGPRELLNPTSSPLAQTSDEENGEFGVLLPSFLMAERGVTNLDHVIIVWAEVLKRLIADEPCRRRMAEAAFLGAQRFRLGSNRDKWLRLLEA